MRRQSRTRMLKLYKTNYIDSKHLLRLPLFLSLIFLSLLYFNHLRINIYTPSKLDNNAAYSNNLATTKATRVSDNAVSVNNWYAKYQQLQSTIIKESGVVQLSLEDNNLTSLSLSCQQLDNSLMAAKQAPIIPNQAAQKYWRQAQSDYLSAIKLCSLPQFIIFRSSADLLGDLKHGDQQLLNSINYILDCC